MSFLIAGELEIIKNKIESYVVKIAYCVYIINPLKAIEDSYLHTVKK